jgi:cytosine/adenosine deaminase-related metal-dependent hydrolase
MEYLQNILGTLGAAFRPDDVYVANLLGMLEALNAGITTVYDWSHIMNTPEHADAAVLGLRASGGRSVFGHGTPGTSVWEWFYESKLPHPTDVRRVRQEHFSATGPEELVTLAMSIRGPEYSTLEVSRHDLELARELGLRASMHVGGGSFGQQYQAIGKLHQAGLLGPDLNFAHCNSLTNEDFQLLAAHGCSVSVTPEIEMQMGLGFPATGKALAHGIRPALGVDVVTGTGGDMFAQMKVALQTERAMLNDQFLAEGKMVDKLSLSTQDVLEFATIEGAKALGLEQHIGSLTPGKQADLVLIDASATNLAPVNNPVSAVVLSAAPANVDSVFVAGRAVKRHGKLLHHDLAALHRRAKASRDYLFAQTGTPVGALCL